MTKKPKYNNISYLEYIVNNAITDLKRKNPIDKFMNQAIVIAYEKYSRLQLSKIRRLTNRQFELLLLSDIIDSFSEISFTEDQLSSYLKSKEKIVSVWKSIEINFSIIF